MDELITQFGTAAFAFLMVGGGLVALAMATRLLNICPPNKVLIFSGRKQKLADGQMRGFRVIFGGRGWRVPLLEQAQWMSLNVMEVPIVIRSAYSKGGIPMNIDAIANVKISSDPILIGNAIERFLGRSQEISRVAKETLEGHLRGVLSTLTPEEVNEDRLKFSESLAKESVDDFRKLGLHLDTLKVQNVSDDVSYLNSIGRKAIANIVRDAEVAESDAQREAAQIESETVGRASVTEANVDAVVVKLENELRRVRADLESKVRSEEERTTAAAAEARAVAEQELQRTRVQLEEIRLQSDQILPAAADRKRREYAARGEAAVIRERGRALGEALDVIHQAWSTAGDAALQISLIEDLDTLLDTATRGVKKVQINNLRMIDSGDGKVLSGYLAAYPAMVQTVFDAVAKTTGIDIPAVIAGKATATGARAPDDPAATTSQEVGS